MLAIAVLWPGSAQAAITVECTTNVSVYSWRPLPKETIGRVVDARVLQALTGSGKLTLKPSGQKKPADLTVRITARVIEDAAQFSVLASAVPRQRDRVGSMAAVATVSIYKMNHKQIQGQMERAADEAAAKLQRLVQPWLGVLGADEKDNKIVPMNVKLRPAEQWAAALALKGGGAGGAVSENKLRDLSARAGKEAGARMALARCAISGGDRRMQERCVDALAQLARGHASAQRALIAVLFSPAPDDRNVSGWQKARRRAFRISTGFSGAAKEEAIQAWLHILASDYSDRYRVFGGRREDYLLMETISSFLARNPAIPNLDLALAMCTRPAKKKQKPPDKYCLKVLKSVPVGRRLSLLFTQLTEPIRYSHMDPWRAWTNMLDAVADRHRPLHPAVTAICMRRIQRSFWDADRRKCLELLGKQAKPTPNLLKFLVAVFSSHDKEISIGVRGALNELVKRKRALCPLMEQTLGAVVASGDFPRHYPGDGVPRALRTCRKPPRR